MKRTGNLVASLLVLLIVIGCQQPNGNELEQFEGELFLKLVDLGSEVYTTPTKDGKTLKDLLESTPKSQLNEEQKLLLENYELLKQERLLDQPYFNFSEDNSKETFVKVYLNKNEYEKVNSFDLSKLKSTNEKVQVKFHGQKINDHLIKCSDIDMLKKVKGEQKWSK